MLDAMSEVHPPIADVRAAVARAIAEDLTPLGDVTSALLPRGRHAPGEVVPRAPGVLAGRMCFEETFAQIGGDVRIEWDADDGAPVEAGKAGPRLHGPLDYVLTAERTALNFLGHLS